MNDKEKNEQIKEAIKTFESKMESLETEYFLATSSQKERKEDDYITFFSNSFSKEMSAIQCSVLVGILSKINNCTGGKLIRFIEMAKKGGLI